MNAEPSLKSQHKETRFTPWWNSLQKQKPRSPERATNDRIPAIDLNQSIFHFCICMFNPLRRADAELNTLLFLESNRSSVCRNSSSVHIKSCLKSSFDLVILCLMIHLNLARRYGRAFWVMRCSCWFDVDHHLARQPETAMPTSASCAKLHFLSPSTTFQKMFFLSLWKTFPFASWLCSQCANV